MASEYTERPTFTSRTYTAGGFLLMIAGLLGAIVGLGLLIAAATAELAPELFWGIVGAFVLVISAIEFAGGWSAYHGRNWYGSMTAGILGLMTIFTFPLDLLGTILIAMGEGQFDREERIEERGTSGPMSEGVEAE